MKKRENTMQKYGARRSKGALAALLAALLLAVLVPVGAILIKDYLDSSPPAGRLEAPEESSVPADPVFVPSKPESRSPSEAVPEPSEPEPPLPGFGLVPEGEAVGPAYFDDAVFFGDSLTDGLGAYGSLHNATFIASTGVNPDSVFTKEAITLPGEEDRCTMFSALGRIHPQKIYIMLGANWVGTNTGIEKKTFLNHYRAMLEKILEQQPDAVIYIQSMLPVSKEYEENTNGNNLVGLTNGMILEYNEALLSLAEEMQVYYLDVHSAMVDDVGYLPSGETSDGMHLTPDYYARWYDYLTTHTAPQAEGPVSPAPEETAPDEPDTDISDEPGEGASGIPESAEAYIEAVVSDQGETVLR